jgi:FlaA1/EpsC-like NDP-sugar epimerase
MTLFITDALIFACTPLFAVWLRFDGAPEPRFIEMVLGQLPFIVGIRLIFFVLFGLYRRLWRYASIPELSAILGAVSAGTVTNLVLSILAGERLPMSVVMLVWLLNVILVGASRCGLRVLHFLRYGYRNGASNVLIVGAGDAGAIIARELAGAYQGQKKLIGFVDDDPAKYKQQLFGAKVLGNRSAIRSLVETQKVNEIIIALPSAGGGVIREIVQKCKGLSCQVRTVPGIYEVIDGRVKVSELRQVDVTDLLRRDPVQLDMAGLGAFLQGKRVLVTGAGGSIGSELCRQIARAHPERLLCLGRGENSIFDISNELREKYPELKQEAIIANVQDEDRLRTIFEQWRPQVVFHAAAHKHVPLMEAQPVEAVRNNIFGTQNVAEMADRFGAEAFVLISTDKAVNPTSVMGTTKRVAELVVQRIAETSATRYSAVRFGNVLGSRGSVIPTFRHQIAAGGPVTVTDPEMKRYFMTIPEAVQLVLQTAVMARGGEVFVLDMGEPVKILDLACDLIELSGLKPYDDIPIQFTGLRPGEKLFEELLTAEEGTTATHHEKIFTAKITRRVDGREFARELERLREEENPEIIRRCLQRLVPTYHQPLQHTESPKPVLQLTTETVAQQSA